MRNIENENDYQCFKSAFKVKRMESKTKKTEKMKMKTKKSIFGFVYQVPLIEDGSMEG